MKKSLSLLATAALLVMVHADNANGDQLMLAVNTNFGPARPATAEEISADQGKAKPKRTKTDPTPVPPKAAPAKPQPVVQTPEPAAPPPPDPQHEAALRAASEEIARRQEAQLASQMLIEEGDRLYNHAQYVKALEKYKAALSALPTAKATSTDRQLAIDGVNRAYYRLAQGALAEQNYGKALEYANQALAVDPDSNAAARLLVKVERAQRVAQMQEENPPLPNPARTEEFLDSRERIRELFRKGKILINSGQLDAAESLLQEVLIIDPYNADATTLLNVINQRRTAFSEEGALKARDRRLWEVSRTWVPPLGREVQKPDAITSGGPIEASNVRQAEMTKKLNSIVFPELVARDAVIHDVVLQITEESRKLDPSGVGINITLLLGEDTSPTPAPLPGEFPDEQAFEPVPTQSMGVPRVNFSLRDIPLIDVLKLMTTAAGLKFRIEPHGVVILPKGVTVEELITKSYPVAPGVVRDVVSVAEDLEERTGDELFVEMGGGGVTTAPQDVKRFFEEAGVPFPQGSSLMYNERSSKIIIRNTADNLEIFEQILRDINETPLQVEIETKFIEINQADLEELGFDWKVGQYIFGDFDSQGGGPNEAFPPGSNIPIPGANDSISGGLRTAETIRVDPVAALVTGQTAGLGGLNQVATLRGVLSNPQFEVVINALSRKGSADLLSAPKVTTVSGNQATITVAQEFIYPSEFEPPQVAQNTVTPAIPGEFKTREVGVLLNVTPTVGADQYTINLTVVPEVSEFLGFIDYSPPDTVNITRNQDGEVTGEQRSGNLIQQPLFASRKLTTTVVIWDGQTVVLGGLIREQVDTIDDKIPFLGDIPLVGRLFRSKVDKRSKLNLLIFVRALLVDPAGNPINAPETLQAVAGAASAGTTAGTN